MVKRIPANTTDLYSIALIDREMIACRPQVIRSGYVAIVLRTIADAIESGNAVAIDSIQWDGYGSLSGSIEWDEIGSEPFTYDLSY